MADPNVDATLDAELAQSFAASARTSLPRAPLYAALCAAIAGDRDLYRLLLHAPATQRLPVLLLACIHHLLLNERSDQLAAWYPNLTDDHRSPDDPALIPTFTRFLETHAEPLRALLATRSTQTNEVGRCALLMAPLGILSEEVGELGLLDVGASGGLNLLLDRYAYRFEAADAATVTLGGGSSVVLDISTTGPVPTPSAMPVIAARLGIDRQPIDVSDPEQAQWLEACVWPDQPDRFHRLVAAIDIARSAPPEVLVGDAVASLDAAIHRVGAHAHPVVTNSWVLNYLTPQARLDYVAELDRIGATRDLSWIYAEAPALVPEIPTGPDANDPHRTVLSMARWRDGARTIEHLATCHPHGFWMHWR